MKKSEQNLSGLLRVAGTAWSLLGPALRRRASITLLLVLLGALFEAAAIALIYPFMALLADIDRAARGDLPVIGDLLIGWSADELMIGVAAAIFALFTAKNLIVAVAAYWQFRLVFNGAADVANRLLRVYMMAPLTWHMRRNIADLQRRVHNAIMVTLNNVVMSSLNAVAEFLVLACTAITLLLIETEVALAAAGFLLVVALVYYLVLSRPAVRVGARVQAAVLSAYSTMIDALGALRELRILGRERQMHRQFAAAQAEQAAARRWQAMFSLAPRPYLEIAVSAAILALVVVLVRERGASTSVAVLGLFAAAGFRFLPSVNRLLQSLQAIRVGETALSLMADDLANTPDRQWPAAGPPAAFRDRIELREVTLRYPDTAVPSLRNVSFALRRGETVGLVGVSGAGKSTLIDVMLGLLTPQSGQVLIDGRDVTGDPHGWRGLFGYVPQAIYVSDDTLRRNVALGLDDAEIDEARLARALERAQLKDLVASLPESLQTRMGERGVRLSGGQRQRIGIARALYAEPAILVLDEGTAALDNETEARLNATIAGLRGQMTVIVVAHRLSTVRDYDRIVLMRDGEIAAIGPFAELVRNSADFARLVELANLDRPAEAAA